MSYPHDCVPSLNGYLMLRTFRSKHGEYVFCLTHRCRQSMRGRREEDRYGVLDTTRANDLSQGSIHPSPVLVVQRIKGALQAPVEKDQELMGKQAISVLCPYYNRSIILLAFVRID